ncbi:MAG: hypothetical protein ABI693_19315 [Bryobacteraceae bacterium]
MLTPEDVDRIAAMPDPVLRNGAITLGYHDLALAMQARAPGFSNWLLFAVWASKQAGQTIRGEDLTANLHRQLRVPSSWLRPTESLWRILLRRGLLSPETRLGRLVRAIPGPLDAIEAASAALAEGNQMIFREIARAFATYLNGLEVDGPLAPAFAHYTHAITEPDTARRTQLQYCANVELAWHEQVRAQPLIVRAMQDPVLSVRNLGERVLVVFAPPGLRVAVLAVAAGIAVKPLSSFGLMLARRLITERLMTLSLPGRMLVLSADIDLPCPQILEKVDLPELKALLDRFDGDDAHCAAEDWSSLNQRMRYIARFFRVMHLDADLAEEPFTEVQAEAIRAGRLPFGSL